MEEMVLLKLKEYNRLSQIESDFKNGKVLVAKKVDQNIFGDLICVTTYHYYSNDDALKQLSEINSKLIEVVNYQKEKIRNAEETSNVLKKRKWYQFFKR